LQGWEEDMTLKQLHEQVGRLPFRARINKYTHNVEALLSTGYYVTTCEHVEPIIWANSTEGWQLVPEKKKALSYSNDAGNIFFVLENSKEHEFIKTSTAFTRQECFDIESK
jgi:hypothetical protein